MKVHKLTEEQKDLLIGKQYTINMIFNPIQDINNDWIISTEEVNHCDNENYMWVKELPLIDYTPIISEEI